MSRLPSLNVCLVTKQTFASFSRAFLVQILSFSFQLWALAVKTTLDFVKFIVNDCEQTTHFFYKSALLEFLFFPKSCLKVGGAA